MTAGRGHAAGAMQPGDLVQPGAGGAAKPGGKHEEVKIPMQQKLVVGAIAGVIGTCCIFPIDVAKPVRKTQTQTLCCM